MSRGTGSNYDSSSVTDKRHTMDIQSLLQHADDPPEVNLETAIEGLSLQEQQQADTAGRETEAEIVRRQVNHLQPA